jgi:hypothetical protein
MSDSETSSDSDFDTQKIKSLLYKLDDLICDSIESTKKIYYKAKEPQDYFTHRFKLTPEAREFFQTKSLSLQDILTLWLPTWKLSPNGGQVQIPQPQASLLHLPTETWLDIYSIPVAVEEKCFRRNQ